MSHQNHFHFGLNITPALPPGTVVGIQPGPIPLLQLGLNFLVEITTSSAFMNGPNPPVRKTISVMAHLDTGASVTSIDHQLAQHLQLIPLGTQKNATASGFAIVNTYAVDIAFLNSQLHGLQNLRVSSCQLPHFNLQDALKNTNIPTNFGILIGRDIMSRWSITWHGPSSTVLISD